MNIHFAPLYLTLPYLPTLITLQVLGFGHLRRSLGEDIIGVRGNAPLGSD